MAIFKFFWKVWLRLNWLTKDVENDYVAEVSTTGKTLRNEDIARLIKEEGSEFKQETLLSILNQRDRIIRTQVQQGYSVLTGTCHYNPRVSGSWIGANAKYNSSVQKVTLDMIPRPGDARCPERGRRGSAGCKGRRRVYRTGNRHRYGINRRYHYSRRRHPY